MLLKINRKGQKEFTKIAEGKPISYYSLDSLWLLGKLFGQKNFEKKGLKN